MPVETLVGIAQYWEAIIAASALVVSILSLLRDKQSRQMDMLHEVFRNIGELNSQLVDYNPSERDEEQRKQDGKIIFQEKAKEFDYLCFLINRNKVKERDVYELGGDDIVDFYESYSDRMDGESYSDIEPVVERWETHPPTTVWNRLILRWKKTRLGSPTESSEGEESESESSSSEDDADGETEKAES
ncbi:hypothetical protein C471_07621 [Halorubrum saccharovorum DSM 1137]|uniref:DUF4760 domain-containing protein n=1 Tax=Halorubrum saccharovorum DSM 1137 TaxID=1227484 RepID=M0E2S3_9EURY|nr:hypothetical protein [Halorubrum saccharovorum]ELZ40634.1 hypothetical protein C471_07621 [Halorubrum saccharovorum DSM 1137]